MRFVALFALIALASCVATASSLSPLWSQNYPNSQYGQVDNVALNQENQLAFGALIAADVFGYNAVNGSNTWGRAPFSGIFGSVATARKSNVVVVLDTLEQKSGPSLILSAYTTTVNQGSPIWTTTMVNSSSDQMLLSHNGNVLAVSINHIVGPNRYQGSVVILNGHNGKQLNTFPCPAGQVTGDLALDPTGLVVAYNCFTPGVQTATIIVRAAIGANSKIFLTAASRAAAGTGFALSHGGNYFAYGVTEVNVYEQQGLNGVYKFLFTANPVNPAFSRLCSSITFEREKVKGSRSTLLAVGFFTVAFGSPPSQQSFVQVYDVSATHNPSQVLWSTGFANSTSAFQDNIAQMVFCDHYLAVATWGIPNTTPPVPAVHFLDSKKGTVVAAYTTPGSMFGIDCYVDQKSAWILTGGKHEHANTMGSGGDLFMFKVGKKILEAAAEAEVDEQ